MMAFIENSIWFLGARRNRKVEKRRLRKGLVTLHDVLL